METSSFRNLNILPRPFLFLIMKPKVDLHNAHTLTGLALTSDSGIWSGGNGDEEGCAALLRAR